MRCNLENQQTKGYSIKINNFEGPFDLLFHLFEKNQVNIYDIPISEITDQYMDYLFAMQEMDLEIASDFLLMASTLLHIKSKMLIPEKKEQMEEIDPREELISRLLEYGKYKEFTHYLKSNEKHWEKAYYKLPEIIEIKHVEPLLELLPEILVDCYKQILLRNKRKINTRAENITNIIQHEKVSLRSKIREVMRGLIDSAVLKFSDIFNIEKKSKIEIVTGFMAILELTKLKRVWIEQKNVYGEIMIHRNDEHKFDANVDMDHIKED
jgi:segregation and condensation protein A